MSECNGKIPHPDGFEQVVALGQVWKLSRISEDIREKFAAWCEQRSFERLEKRRARLSGTEYLARRQQLYDHIEAGAYDWGFPLDPDGLGDAVLKARQTGEGQARLTQLLMEAHHGDVDVKQIAAAFADQPEAFQAALQRALDPNSASPAPQAATGTPATSQTPTTA